MTQVGDFLREKRDLTRNPFYLDSFILQSEESLEGVNQRVRKNEALGNYQESAEFAKDIKDRDFYLTLTSELKKLRTSQEVEAIASNQSVEQITATAKTDFIKEQANWLGSMDETAQLQKMGAEADREYLRAAIKLKDSPHDAYTQKAFHYWDTIKLGVKAATPEAIFRPYQKTVRDGVVYDPQMRDAEIEAKLAGDTLGDDGYTGFPTSWLLYGGIAFVAVVAFLKLRK